MADKKRRIPGDQEADAVAALEDPEASDAADTGKLRVLERSAGEHHATVNGGHAADHSAEELEDTGQFPPLAADDRDAATARAAAPVPPEERASFWLNHLEREIQRLQAKWDLVADELRLREERLDQLRREVQAKGAVAEGLRHELGEQAAAKAEISAELARAASRIEELTAELTQRELEVAAGATKLADAEREIDALEGRLTASESDIERLTAAVQAAELAAVTAEQRHAGAIDASNELRTRIQELESYIDGRQQSWSALNAKVASYQDALEDAERSLAEKAAELAAKGAESDRLAATIAELERDRLESTERSRRLDGANTELEARSAEQAATIGQLRAELARAAGAAEQSSGLAVRREELIASLERGVVRRDQTIDELEAAVQRAQRVEADLAAEKTKLEARVAELEAGLSERQKRIEKLDASAAEVEHAVREAEERAAKLERLLREAATEMSELQSGLVARDRLVERLEAELAAKQEALDGLERNARRLTDLGASLDGLDRRLGSPPVEILSADLRETGQALPENLSPVEGPVATTVAGSAGRGRKLIIAVDGKERTSYPLPSGDVTIGRGATSDIRVRSPFISRLHARIFTRDDDTFVEDLGSKNGVLLNSVPVERSAALHDGDVISLGGTLELKYVDLERPAAGDREGRGSATGDAPPAAR